MCERLHRLLAEYRAALERDPHNPQLLAALGQVLEELGYRADAGQHYYAAALGYEQCRNLREAADCCARVLVTQPGNLDAVALLRRLGDESTPAARPHRVSEGQVVLQGTATASDYPTDMSTDSLDRGQLAQERAYAAPSPGAPPAKRSEASLASTGSGKRPRLRTRRPRRKVSPLDRTVVDSEAESSGADSLVPSEPTTPHELQRTTRVEGTRPPQKPRWNVSPLDRTEIEPEPSLSTPSLEVPKELSARQRPDADEATSVESRWGNRGRPNSQEAPATRPPVRPAPPTPKAGYRLPAAVLQLARSVSYSRGEVVFREADEGSDLLVVQAGQVQVSRRGPEGPQLLDTLEAGEFFGEMGMLGDGYRHATVRALRPTRVQVLTRAQARQLMKDDRAANRALRRAYRDRLQELLVALSPLLRQLSPTLVDRVLSLAKPVTCPVNQVVMVAGRDAPGLFFVLLGRVEVLSPTGETLGHLGDGDCFGHLSLLRGQPSDCAIRAERFTQLLRIAPVQFAQLTGEEESLARVFDQAAQSWSRTFIAES